MTIGTPAVGGSTGQMQLVVNHVNGAQFYFEPRLGPGIGIMPAGSAADQEALMQAIVSALDGHPDLTVQATVVYDAGAAIAP